MPLLSSAASLACLLHSVCLHTDVLTGFFMRSLQVVNPDGKPANIPNTNNATVTGLASLSQDVINPMSLAVMPEQLASPCSAHWL